MNIFRRHVIQPLRSGRALRHLGLVLSALALGPAWLVLLVTGWSLGVGLLITLVGIPILLGLMYAVRGAMEVERQVVSHLGGVRLARPARPLWSGSFLSSLRDALTDQHMWRAQGYLLLRMAVGVPLAAAVLAVIGTGAQMVALFTYYSPAGGVDIGIWQVDTLGEALAFIPPGLVLLTLAVPLADGAGALWTAIARGAVGVESAAVPPTAAGPASAPTRRTQAELQRALGIHAACYIAFSGALMLVWVATTPGGYVWPLWPMIVFGTFLAIHAAAVLAPRLVPGAGLRGLALARHAGVSLSVSGFFVAVWLMTTPGGYFWPVWPIAALAVPLALHAGYVFVGLGARDDMAERIDILTTTRAGAVDAQAAELRRIERDLHDGAQARLVALAMDLGMARERLDDAPDEARALVDEAHEQAKRALGELRDLARGIHPAVLADRGLPAAVKSLAGASRIAIAVDVDLARRLDPAIEAAAYFVVAEAIANATKHSEAKEMTVAVTHDGRALRVRVADDGVGGADPEGEGLTGLRRRVEAHDGALAVISPPGAGTVVEAVIPCAS